MSDATDPLDGLDDMDREMFRFEAWGTLAARLASCRRELAAERAAREGLEKKCDRMIDDCDSHSMDLVEEMRARKAAEAKLAQVEAEAAGMRAGVQDAVGKMLDGRTSGEGYIAEWRTRRDPFGGDALSFVVQRAVEDIDAALSGTAGAPLLARVRRLEEFADEVEDCLQHNELGEEMTTVNEIGEALDKMRAALKDEPSPCKSTVCSGVISPAHGKCTVCNRNHLDEGLPAHKLYDELRAALKDGGG
jgi:hypothetical protein